jgi:hypothetical protein
LDDIRIDVRERGVLSTFTQRCNAEPGASPLFVPIDESNQRNETKRTSKTDMDDDCWYVALVFTLSTHPSRLLAAARRAVVVRRRNRAKKKPFCNFSKFLTGFFERLSTWLIDVVVGETIATSRFDVLPPAHSY